MHALVRDIGSKTTEFQLPLLLCTAHAARDIPRVYNSTRAPQNYTVMNIWYLSYTYRPNID